jgi:hypothetical protein
MGIGSIVGSLAGDLTGGLTSYYAGQSAKSALRSGRNAANALDQQGADEFKSAVAQGTQRADPYISAGASALQNKQDLLKNGLPQQSGAFNFDAWKDPSTNYSISESNRALQAAGLAGGNAGGALAKALQGNAFSLGQTAYNNAYQRYLQQNTQDFGQQQTNFQNQSQGFGDLINGGQNMVTGVNNMGMQGATGRAGAFNNMANRTFDTGLQIAGLNAGQGSGIGQSVQSGMKDFSAGAKAGDFGSFLSSIF